MKRLLILIATSVTALAADPEDAVPAPTTNQATKVVLVQPEQCVTLTLRWKRIAPNSWELIAVDGATITRTVVTRSGAEIASSEDAPKTVSLLDQVKQQTLNNAPTNVTWLPGFVWTANSGATRVDLGKAPTGIVRAVRAQ